MCSLNARSRELAWVLMPAGKGWGQAMAMLCASVRENSRQCRDRLSAGLQALGSPNRYKASANASAGIRKRPPSTAMVVTGPCEPGDM